MALETEAVLDRRALKRRAGLWRAVAILAFLLAAGAIAHMLEIGTSTPRHVARVSIDGFISDDRRQQQLLKRIAENDQVRALLLSINSTGGSTTGGEALFESIRAVAEKKPVVAQFGTVAASAAYIAGLAADHIVARGNTITGSVGVIFQWPEVSGLLDKLGVKVNGVKSGNLKAVPSLFQPEDAEGRKVTEEFVNESQRWFVALVRDRRKVDTAAIPGLEQGRIYSGREALQHNLIDSIGGEAEALRWLEAEHKIPASTRVMDWRPRSSTTLLGALAQAFAGLAGGAGGEVLSTFSEASGLAQRVMLDGLLSVWQPYEK